MQRAFPEPAGMEGFREREDEIEYRGPARREDVERGERYRN